MMSLLILDIGIFALLSGAERKHHFDIRDNYKTWSDFNWLGVSVLTTLYYITFAPVAIFYLIYKLFTFGRRK